MTVEPPPHHVRYARAWDLYRDESLSDEARQILEQEMDAAQDHFNQEEFRVFKQTLPGYLAHWKKLKRDMTQKLGVWKDDHGIT